MSVKKSEAAAPSALNSLDTFNRRKRIFYSVAGVFLLALLGLGVMGKQGWLPGTDAMTGRKTGWFGSQAKSSDAASALSAANPAAVLTSTPSATPQLSKEYIYAGSRMLAVEDANANAAPPADLAVWRSSNGGWYSMGGQNSQPTSFPFGQTGDQPVQGDYDGDGRTDFAVFRAQASSGNNEATWFVQPSSGGSYYAFQFGFSTDQTAPADYDGDGRTDIAIWRASNGLWVIYRSSDNTLQTYQLGDPTDLPVAADFDGDGKADPAVYRAGASTGTNPSNFYYLRSSQPNAIYQNIQLGQTGDRPVTGDFDGDGKSDIGVYRPAGAASNWFISMSGQNYSSYTTTPWGDPDDKLVPNDYDGDGKVDIAVWRPTNGTWYILQSSRVGQADEARVVPWGQEGDTPVPAFYRR